jgi:MscS family membrane protein
MPAWTADRNFVLLNGQWLGLVAILFFGWLIAFIVNFNVKNVVIRFLTKDHVFVSEKIKTKFYRAIKWLIISLTWLMGVRLLELHLDILSPLLRAGKVIFVLSSVVLIFHFCDFVAAYFLKRAKQTEDGFDDILVPLLQKTSKFLVIAIGFILMGQSVGLDMKGILAGLGIGGLAFAFAAKDALANFFGSLMVLFDRPFHMGDWIVVDGGIEGQVEEVGLRSTKIRTFYNSLIIIPNGNLSNAVIDNYNQRKFRRMKTTLGVQYDTPPEKIEAFCEGIRELIINNNYARKDYFNVYLNEMADSSLNILLHLFWEVRDYPSELSQRHHLLIDIIRLAKKLDVDFAFPTRTLHMYTEEKSEGVEMPKEGAPQLFGKNLAKEVAKKPISPKGPRSSIESTEKFDPKEFGSED